MKYALLIVAILTPTLRAEARKETPVPVKILRTPAGIRFGILGSKGTMPAPTLFVFASSIQESLGNKDFNQVGQLLTRHGFLSVSLDLPCHGEDVKGKDDSGLGGWRKRLEKGDALVPAFTAKVARVLDYLVKEGYTDPKRVVACGTSRGGFIALHFAAAEPRVRCVVAFAPVTNLLALSEFGGMEKHVATRKLAANNLVDKLAGRPIWLCIGNNDQRVSTDDAIAFTRLAVKAAVARKKLVVVDLHVLSVIGHTIHATAHQEAADWIRRYVKAGK